MASCWCRSWRFPSRCPRTCTATRSEPSSSSLSTSAHCVISVTILFCGFRMFWVPFFFFFFYYLNCQNIVFMYSRIGYIPFPLLMTFLCCDDVPGFEPETYWERMQLFQEAILYRWDGSQSGLPCKYGGSTVLTVTILTLLPSFIKSSNVSFPFSLLPSSFLPSDLDLFKTSFQPRLSVSLQRTSPSTYTSQVGGFLEAAYTDVGGTYGTFTLIIVLNRPE